MECPWSTTSIQNICTPCNEIKMKCSYSNLTMDEKIACKDCDKYYREKLIEDDDDIFTIENGIYFVVSLIVLFLCYKKLIRYLKTMNTSELPTESIELTRTDSFKFSEMTMNDFKLLRLLKGGKFGKIVQCQRKNSNEYLVIKMFKKGDYINSRQIKLMFLKQEIFPITDNIQHPFLINLFGVFEINDYVCFLMEYAAGGNLVTYIRAGMFLEPSAIFYSACVVLALEYLHKKNVIYRGLKLDKLLLDIDGFVKLSDFGLSKDVLGCNDRTSSSCGAQEFLAPEIFQGRKNTRSLDWWSVGVLIFEMLVREPPFYFNENKPIGDSILRDEIRFPNYLSVEAVDIIRNLLEKNPEYRLGSNEKDAEDIKIHKFFSDINWNDLSERKITPPFLPITNSNEDFEDFDQEYTSETP